MEDGAPPRWPMIGGIAAIAATVGFGAAWWLLPQSAPAPVAAPAAEASVTELKIPAATLQTSNILVEPIAAAGSGGAILAPATVAATPQGEAIVVARASGTITRIAKRLGDVVHAGETLALVDSLDAATMTADRSVAAAKVEQARRAYARESALFAQGVSPRQDMETAQSALAVAQAEARRAASVAGAAHVAGNGRSVAVVSPLSGRISAEIATLGGYVEPQTELFHVANSSAVQVEAAVTAEDARRIAPGDTATILIGAGAAIDATVRTVTPAASGASQTVTVVLAPSVGSPELVVGRGVQVRIRARGSGANGASIPEEAVQSLDGRDVVFVRTKEGFRVQPVTVGTRSGGIAQILSGAQAGTPVATRNAFLLKAELKKGAEEDE